MCYKKLKVSIFLKSYKLDYLKEKNNNFDKKKQKANIFLQFSSAHLKCL